MAKRQADPLEAPYKPSRAALRDYYGTRAINASAPQSPLDYTPSGRLKYRMEQDKTPVDPAIKRSISELSVDQQFKDNFKPRTPGFDPVALDPTNSPWRGVYPATAAYAPPAPPQAAAGQPPPAGSPTPLNFNLAESSPYSAAEIAPYAPPAGATPYVPPWRKKETSGYMGSILGDANKWLGKSEPVYSTGQPVPKFHQNFNRFMDKAVPTVAGAVMNSINPILPVLKGAQRAVGGFSDLIDTSATGGSTIKSWLDYVAGRNG